MVAAPIFGYLGDRFNRKVILSCGIFFWSAVTFSSSFITQQYFWLLVLSRGLVGIGEASYSTIAPTIIGDLFNRNTRTLMLSIFYFAIPLGSGLGYITGSSAKQVAGDWHWALRVSPVMGMITGTLILLFVPAARRGYAEQLGGQLKARTSWLRDMRALIRKPAHSWRGGDVPSPASGPWSAGGELPERGGGRAGSPGRRWGAGPLGLGLPVPLGRAGGIPLRGGGWQGRPGLGGAGASAQKQQGVCVRGAPPVPPRRGLRAPSPPSCLPQICIFIGETLLFSNWAITADILMYVVIPTRRATAVALQSFTSHLLGDAGSPYLIGFISDLIRQSTRESALWEFLSLGYALMLCPFVVVLGGMFFLATALFFLSDRAKAEQQVNQLMMPPAAVKV
ncbi:protein spinster homolog 2 [Sarcophilus harrisii]|uniref:protein spinster homolog 2 n=1 Tax=Sarcophilus harrisii TaxID=9305 RepID=UPI001301F23B|nr:protein spinster homolog 2 [Sarcophilus harrisii]